MWLGVYFPSPQITRHYSMQTVKASTLSFHMLLKSNMRRCVIMPPEGQTREIPSSIRPSFKNPHRTRLLGLFSAWTTSSIR